MSTDYSRPLRMAAQASGLAEPGLRTRLEAVHIHVTAEFDVPGVPDALKILVGNLRRLPVRLALDPRGLPTRLAEECQALARTIDPDRPLVLAPTVMDPDAEGSVHVGLHLGPHPPRGTAISAAPDGHGVRLRRPVVGYPALSGTASGLGSVMTAAMLTAECFKTITGLPPGQHRKRDRVDLCPVALGANPGQVAAGLRNLPPLALVGGGAVGTAVAAILRLLPVEGLVSVVDPEAFELPNVITYSLGTLTDAEQRIAKVDLLARELMRSGRLDVVTVRGTAQDLIKAIDTGASPWPQVVISGVDSITARHEAQRIYADLTLDASSGGQAGTTLALHEAFPTGPCLRCYYPERPTSGSPITRLHNLTGLPVERLARGDIPLEHADLVGLPREARNLLTPHLGKPVCGLSNLMAVTIDSDGYRPSATFVAQQAAALAVGALIARQTGLVTQGPRHIEYDARFGPNAGMRATRRPRHDCACQTDQKLIAQIRSHRATRSRT